MPSYTENALAAALNAVSEGVPIRRTVTTHVATWGLAPTSPRLMAEYRENDSGANRKNSCNRSYRSYRNYRTDHTEAALISQPSSI